jgi:hypothetical protein
MIDPVLQFKICGADFEAACQSFRAQRLREDQRRDRCAREAHESKQMPKPGGDVRRVHALVKAA